ncbi:MAG: anhydro-N-acetylmuramic acid kinase AnmK [Veillonellales bacterium]
MQRLLRLYEKRERLVVGLMSGTSLDGIDAVLVKITGNGIHSQVSQIAFKTVSYDAATRQSIREVCRPETSTAAKICSLNFVLGGLFADAVIDVCREAGIRLSDLDLIASHGQTIWHQPGISTLQIGEAAVIAERTGVITVADFRVRDVAAGGQGAPLVPYSEYLLYRHPRNTRLLQNIGGIANVTVLPAGGGAETVTAFDTGPGNMMLDFAVGMLTNGRLQYDTGGEWARKGCVNESMLAGLMSHPYMNQSPPKTTGREVFGDQYTAEVVGKNLAHGVNTADILATLTCFTAKSIAAAYRRFILPLYKIDEVILSGGGSHNQTLVARLRRELPDIPVRLQEELGFSSDAKEAVAFALLGNEAISGHSNNLPAVTGARIPVVMGKISF